MRIGRFVVAVGVASSLGFARTAPAAAYFTTDGVGNGAAQVGTLHEAQIVVTVSGAGVQVLWPAVVGPNVVPVDGYIVERLVDGTPTVVCGTAPSPMVQTVCNDPVGPGAYQYRVTTVFRSWSSEATSAQVTIGEGEDDVEGTTTENSEVTTADVDARGFPTTLAVAREESVTSTLPE